MPFINQRWLGGMLTNFDTISKRVGKMLEYERMRDTGEFAAMPKKEALHYSRELEKLERNLGGIRSMTRAPDAIFVLDTKKEQIAVTEANKLRVPVVAVVDTNCDPDVIQFVVPGNDDAIRAASLMCRIVSDAVQEGRFIASKKGVVAGPGPAAPAPVERSPEERARHAAEQAEARRQAAAQAREREARIARHRDQAPAAPAAPASEPAETPAPAADEAAVESAEAPAPSEPEAAAAPAPTETEPAEAPASAESESVEAAPEPAQPSEAIEATESDVAPTDAAAPTEVTDAESTVSSEGAEPVEAVASTEDS